MNAPVSDVWRAPQPPRGYELAERSLDGGALYVHRGFPTHTVIISAAWEQDRHLWVHISMALPNRLPTWEEMVRMKEAFLGPECRAIQVIPKRSEYVNIHKFCLHLFACLTEPDIIPDFSRGSGSL